MTRALLIAGLLIPGWAVVQRPAPFRADVRATPSHVVADGQTLAASRAQSVLISKYGMTSNGLLRIWFDDGMTVEIPLERGRFDVVQAGFSDIQIAADRVRIGWLAEYPACAQSYPCPTDLVIYRAGSKLVTIAPPYGIVWNWAFLANGGQAALHFGFPHGDATGGYALHDSDSGRELASYSPGQASAPEWVRQLQSRRK